ncbi:MAG: zf-HC2 domain-containing protein [Gammaproteobacteria bacterium]|nr:zf-HC2 domain-containing protein [Gammaproteobacteria bacterium]
MNCEQFEQFLNEQLDGNLSDDIEQIFQEHMNQCSDCQNHYSKAIALKAALETYPVLEPDEQYEVRMLSVLKQDKTRSEPHWVASLVGGALAASIMMWIFFVPTSDINEMGLEQISVTLPYQQRKDVQLVFKSPVEINEANFTIVLPDNVEIYGRPGIRELSWKGQIISGNNRLKLPLVAQGNVEGELTAKLTSGENSKIFVIKLTSSPETTIQFIEQSNKAV